MNKATLHVDNYIEMITIIHIYIPFSFLSSSTHPEYLQSQSHMYSTKTAHQSTRNINRTVQIVEYGDVAFSETIVHRSV